MSFQVSRKLLSDALGKVNMALAKSGTDGLLCHALFREEPDGLKLTAVNRNLWAEHKFPLPDLFEENVFGLNGGKLIELLKQSDSEEFAVNVDPRQMTVTLTEGSTAYSMDALFDVPFPEFTEDWQEAEVLDTYQAATLLQALTYLKVFLDPTSKLESHKLLELRNQQMLAGTGKNVGIYKDPNFPGTCKIPSEALPGIISWLKQLDPQDPVTLLRSATRYYLKHQGDTGESVLGWNQVVSAFPTIEDALNATPVRYTLTLSKSPLERTVKRLALMLPDKQDKISLDTTSATLHVSVVNSRGHRSEETVPCHKEGAHNVSVFHLNYQILLAILSQLPEDLVTFHVTDRFLMIKQTVGEQEYTGIAAFKTADS